MQGIESVMQMKDGGRRWGEEEAQQQREILSQRRSIAGSLAPERIISVSICKGREGRKTKPRI